MTSAVVEDFCSSDTGGPLQEESFMTGFTRRCCWLAVVAVYWCCAVWFLFRVAPILVDGGGPSPTFYWGSHYPTPTLQEYDRNIGIRLQFQYPYWCAASIITIAGCVVAPWLVRRWRPRRSHVVLAASGATLLLLLAVAAVSDIGIVLHIWWGPTMYGGYMLPLLKVVVPMSLFAGLLAFIRNGVNT
jgi:hypothetical protein